MAKVVFSFILHVLYLYSREDTLSQLSEPAGVVLPPLLLATWRIQLLVCCNSTLLSPCTTTTTTQVQVIEATKQT